MKRTHFILLIGVLAVTMSLFTACGPIQPINVGAGDPDGMYDKFSRAYVQGVKKSRPDMKIRVKNTTGSEANLRLLDKHMVQVSISQENVAMDAYYGKNAFAKDDALSGLRAIAALYDEQCQIIVLKKSKYKDVSDLIGKKVNLGEKESGSYYNARQILEAYGLSSSVIKESHLGYEEAAQALKEGKLDALFVTAGKDIEFVHELADAEGIRLLSIDKSTTKILEKTHGYYMASVIPAGTYKGQDKDVATVRVRSLLMVDARMKDETVKILTASLFKDQSTIDAVIPARLSANEEEATQGVTIPFHEGAAQYYKSKGITVRSLADGEMDETVVSESETADLSASTSTHTGEEVS